VTVTEGLNFRNVNAKALADAKPLFLHMIGVNGLKAPGASTAEQRVNNVEIVLVLDISGSMSGTKLANLKTAASEFVDTVLTSDADDRISIAVVPYNAQVNVGPSLRAKYVTSANDNGVAGTTVGGVPGVGASSCFEIPSSMYTSPGLPNTSSVPLTPIPMMAHADFFYDTNRTNSAVSPTDNTAKPVFVDVYCRTNAENIIRLPAQNIATLKTQINALTAGGNTSIMTGMKWGLALIDPSARPMFNALVSEGKMPSPLRGRPFDYTDTEAIKVIVLMTDGEHVSHDRVVDAFKTGASPIWLSTRDGNYSVFHASRSGNKFWVPHLSRWDATAWNSGTTAQLVQQDWRDVWAKLKVSYVAWQFYARALGTSNSDRTNKFNSKYSEIVGQFASVSTMDSQLQQSCGLAKTNGVIVYGIAFDAPSSGQQQISQCSSGLNYYFASTASDIKSAFRTIATNISQLRLTQ
jgi:hypothetical protein